MKITNHKLIVSSLLSSFLALSGCATTALQVATQNKPPTRTTLFTDKVIAVGQSIKPIPKHEYALILAGEKNSYLIEPTGDNKKLFADILQQVDFSALFLQNYSELNQEKISYNFAVEVDDNNCKYAHGCKWVNLYFKKPLNQVNTTERDTLKTLDFKCNDTKVKNYLTCNRAIHAGVTIAPKAENFDNLKYRLDNPINIDFFQMKEEGGGSNAFKKGVRGLLYIPAVAVDLAVFIVSMPILTIAYELSPED